MKNLEDLEKKINSELTTKINKTEIKHNQIYLETDKDDLVDVCLFLKTNKDTKFRQLIDITAVDYPEQSQRFKLVYLFLSHEFNQRLVLKYLISENEVIPSLTSMLIPANPFRTASAQFPFDEQVQSTIHGSSAEDLRAPP